jgi:hypothetical protein
MPEGTEQAYSFRSPSARNNLEAKMVGTGRFELPTPRTPSECSTRLSHVPTRKESATSKQRIGLTPEFYTRQPQFRVTRWVFA